MCYNFSMPDNMTPESRTPVSSSIQSMRNLGLEEARNFPQPTSISEAPGAAGQLKAAQEFPKPEATGYIPDIRMQNDPNSPDYIRWQAEMARLFGPERNIYERDPLGLYSAASNYTETMLKYWRLPERGSKKYDEEKEKEVMDELDRNYRLAIASGNRSVNETLAMLEAFVPPKPFEANMQERRLQDARQNLEAMAVFFDSKIPEKIVGRYRVYDAVGEQQIALFNILCAAGGGLEGYFDALKQAGETLISRARFHASAVDFRAAYTNDDPGVSTFKLSPEEKAFIKDTLASKEIRETQVEMLSQARRLIMFNVDVAQFDADKPVGEEGIMRLNPKKIQEKQNVLNKTIADLRAKGKNDEVDRVQKHVDSLERVKHLNLENHREFMRLVFGKIDKGKWVKWTSPDTGREIATPKEILTWYASLDKVEDREVWLSKMMATLLWKKDSKSLSDFLETASEAEILRAAKEITEKAEYIKSNIGDKLINSSLEFAAAKIALVSWIEQDKAFQTAGQLAWMYHYDDQYKGRPFGKIERLYESGGLYKAFDSVNLWAYWRRWTSYKATLKSATTFFGPASDSWRREVSKHSPDWLPPLNRIDANVKIKKIHDRFFDTDPDHPDPKTMLWRAQRLTGNDKLTEAEMKDMITRGKLKEPKIDKFMQERLLAMGWTFGSAYEVPIPMYLPKTFKINLEEMMVDKNTGETLWDLYRMGIMPKDVDWDVYNYESLDRMWVSMSMLTRFAKFFVDTYEAERDPQYQAFFKDASPQSIAEMAKRIYLAFRDLPEGYQHYIVAIVPFMIAQNTASAVGLTLTDFGSAGAKERVLKQWNFVMGQWIRAAMWIPEVILDDGQLYPGAKQDIQSLRNDIALMVMYYKHIFEKVAQAAYKSDKSLLPKFYNDQKALYGGSLKDEMSAEPGEATFSFGPEKTIEPFSDGEKAVAALLFGERR